MSAFTVSLAKVLLSQSQLGEWLGKLPVIRDVYARRVWVKNMNLYFGVYNSYSEARENTPSYIPSGWNNENIAELLIGSKRSRIESGTFQSAHYITLFWLLRLLRNNMQVIDYGGAGGISYELFTQYCNAPPGLKWHVVDVAASVERGKLRHNSNTAISFGASLVEAPPSDFMLVSGCLQYVEDPLGQLHDSIVDQLCRRPQFILINKIPLTERKDFWTLQNVGPSIVPYHVFCRDRLTSFFESKGYTLRDWWTVPEIGVDIPFHPRFRVPRNSGLLFELRPMERQT